MPFESFTRGVDPIGDADVASKKVYDRINLVFHNFQSSGPCNSVRGSCYKLTAEARGWLKCFGATSDQYGQTP